MLRLTVADGETVTLRAEGELVEQWVDLLEDECRRLGIGGGPVAVDLGGLTYVDARGIERLRSLVTHGVTLVRCPPLVRDLLDGE